MRLTDEELKRLLQEETRRAPRSDCPDPDLFRRARESALSDDEGSQLADHFAGCSDCAEEYRLIGELKGWADGADAMRPKVGLRWLAVAASLLLVSMVSLVLWSPWVDDTSVTRGKESPASAIQPGDGVSLRAAPAYLSWAALPDAVSRVEIYDAESVPLWTSPRTTENRVELPEPVRERLQAGGAFYWRVFSESQIRTIRSDLHRFTIEP